MENRLTIYINRATLLLRQIKIDVGNIPLQNHFVETIRHIVDFGSENATDCTILCEIMCFLVSAYYWFGELDHKSVENVLDALVVSRIVIRRYLNDIPEHLF